MSEKTSPKIGIKYGVEMVCCCWKFSRSTFYHQSKGGRKKGKLPVITDQEVLIEIEQDIEKSPFKGEGHRKVHARIRKKVCIGRNRVLNIMRKHKLLSPHRYPSRQKNPHDGRITTNHPAQLWATDAAKIYTLEDGWVWFFGVIEHWNAECVGWHLTKKGDRFAAIEAMTQALERVYNKADSDVARGLSLRVDHGSQFLSEGFRNQIRYWGIALSKAFVREPETNGVVERFHRTLKEQVIHGKQYHSIIDLKQAVAHFILTYNENWILEKLGYRSPNEARRQYLEGKNVLKMKTISTGSPQKEVEHGYFVLAASKNVEVEGTSEK